MAAGFGHLPVLVEEVVEAFGPVPPGLVVDATVGGGGHAEAILAAHPHLSVLGIDRDPRARAAAEDALEPFGARATVVAGTADRLAELARGHTVVGVLMDLGVSSAQIDEPGRGFSYRSSGPLDMRMDPTTGATARDLLQSLDARELEQLIAQLGDERYARRIASAIIDARPIETTGELAEVVAAAVPAAARRRGDPAKRTFQAIRMAVNDELGMLERALEAAIDVLVPGGRLVTIAYHSGEDRMIKRRLAEGLTGGCVCPPRLECVCGAVPQLAYVGRRVRKPSESEIQRNPRSSSARMRVAQRLEEVHR